MAGELLPEETELELTIGQRVDLVLDLTRRIELLDDLLDIARQRRGATDAEADLWAARQVVAQAVMPSLWTH